MRSSNALILGLRLACFPADGVQFLLDLRVVAGGGGVVLRATRPITARRQAAQDLKCQPMYLVGFGRVGGHCRKPPGLVTIKV